MLRSVFLFTTISIVGVLSCYFSVFLSALYYHISLKLRKCKDISVIGFDDIPLCTIIEPTLSTIRVPKQQMGEVAAQRLIELIKSDRNVNTKIEVETKLILRDSV
ncbi:substrate-binding domain-containing protein [Butyrivibrio sp. FCS006]|uniref:substrate-binding domain-containing protein n=1 Tax=Butyrivibrio sp. FCS006 TaxID=1280684 RepID=UPI0018CB0149